MKKILIAYSILLCCIAINSSTWAQNMSYLYEQLSFPELNGTQSVKGLVKLKWEHPHSYPYVIAKTGDNDINLGMEGYIDEIDALWWIIEDYNKRGFALVSAQDGSKWVYAKQFGETVKLILEDNSLKDNEEDWLMSNGYFFEFQMTKNETIEDKAAYFHSLKFRNHVWRMDDYEDHLALVPYKDSDTDWYKLTYETLEGFSQNYISVPMFESDYHKKDMVGNFEATRISPKFPIDESDNKSIVGSGDITILEESGKTDMFKVSFGRESIAKVGLLQFQYTKYNKAALQAEGSRKLTAGIGIDNLGDIYLFKNGITKYTSFTTDKDITFGYEKGKLVANQIGKKTVTLTGIPTPVLLNAEDGNIARLIAKIQEGSVELAYKPESILITAQSFGSENLPVQSVTDPEFSSSKDSGKPFNTFNWKDYVYSIRYKINGQATTESVISPFYDSKEEAYAPIAAKYDSKGNYLGGEDFSTIDGWELVKVDFGFDISTQKPKPDYDLRSEPYMMLYNRYSGKVRVFLYINNPTIANNLQISLVDRSAGTTTTPDGTYGKPRLWSSYLQEKALDDDKISTASYSKIVPLSSNTSGKFFFADFTFNYDPCVCFFESNLELKVDKITQGDLSITGKTLGGQIPSGAKEYKDFMKQSDNFLTSVMDTPYGEQSQTLGDVSFKNLNDWGMKDWSNETSFTLPGKKVKAWEREALRLEYEATVLMAEGESISALGKGVKAAGKAFPDILGTNTGKQVEAVGEVMDAHGSGVKATGRGFSAHAIKIRLDNLKDEKDKNIPLKFPDPQPSVVFSELAAKGTLKIETPVFNNVIITTPGSKNSNMAPNDYKNGSKGGYPIYNEPLGVFNTLYKPEVAVAVVKNENDLGANLRIKTHPYITTNMDNVFGDVSGVFMVSYIVTTYDTTGNSEEVGYHTRGYSLYGSNAVKFPEEIDISGLINKNLIIKNLQEKSNPSEADWKNWISVDMEVEYFGYTGRNEAGGDNGNKIRQSYTANSKFVYNSNVSGSLSKKAKELALQKFPDYKLHDVDTWEKNYIVTPNTEGFKTHMKSFCEQTVEQTSAYTLAEALKPSNKEEGESTLNKMDIEGFMVYPNPSENIFNVNYKALTTGNVTFEVYNIYGQLLVSHNDYATKEGNAMEATVNLSALNDGIYLLNIKFENGNKYASKLVKTGKK